jgi:GNAT superfamily N-acetyltransferase
MGVRRAKVEDLPTLYGMAQRYIAESSLPVTYDHVRTHMSFCRCIEYQKGAILLVDEDEESKVLCGGVMGYVYADFCKERFAYIDKLYVEKEFRGLGSARDLVQAFEVEARKLDAKIIVAGANAAMGEKVEKLFTNLFEKFDYKSLGRTLIKEI